MNYYLIAVFVFIFVMGVWAEKLKGEINNDE